MRTAATHRRIDAAQVSELLDVARSILQRHHDQDLAEKTFAMKGYLEMSKTYPERDYREALVKAFTDLSAAVQSHLNAELEAIGALFRNLP